MIISVRVIDNEFLIKEILLENEEFTTNSASVVDVFFDKFSSLEFTSTGESFYKKQNESVESVEIIQAIRNEISKENKYFLYQINSIKNTLDLLTDVMENENLLNLDKLQDLVKYLDKNKSYLASCLK